MHAGRYFFLTLDKARLVASSIPRLYAELSQPVHSGSFILTVHLLILLSVIKWMRKCWTWSIKWCLTRWKDEDPEFNSYQRLKVRLLQFRPVVLRKVGLFFETFSGRAAADRDTTERITETERVKHPLSEHVRYGIVSRSTADYFRCMSWSWGIYC